MTDPRSTWRQFWEAWADHFHQTGAETFRDYLEQSPELFAARAMHEVGGVVNAASLDRRADEFASKVAGYLRLVGELEPDTDEEVAAGWRRTAAELEELSKSELGGLINALGEIVAETRRRGHRAESAISMLVLNRVLEEAERRDPEDAAAAAAILKARIDKATLAREDDDNAD